MAELPSVEKLEPLTLRAIVAYEVIRVLKDRGASFEEPILLMPPPPAGSKRGCRESEPFSFPTACNGSMVSGPVVCGLSSCARTK